MVKLQHESRKHGQTFGHAAGEVTPRSMSISVIRSLIVTTPSPLQSPSQRGAAMARDIAKVSRCLTLSAPERATPVSAANQLRGRCNSGSTEVSGYADSVIRS
jgi:hypothetical protein